MQFFIYTFLDSNGKLLRLDTVQQNSPETIEFAAQTKPDGETNVSASTGSDAFQYFMNEARSLKASELLITSTGPKFITQKFIFDSESMPHPVNEPA